LVFKDRFALGEPSYTKCDYGAGLEPEIRSETVLLEVVMARLKACPFKASSKATDRSVRPTQFKAKVRVAHTPETL